MIESGQTHPKVIELARRVRDTQYFLVMAAIELRHMAEASPDLADELRHIAQKIQSEAEDLARLDIEPAPTPYE